MNIGEKSILKAFAFFESGDIEKIEIGTAKGLCQLHAYIFDELFDFAGKIRQQLQRLRDKGYIRFLSNGKYEKLFND